MLHWFHRKLKPIARALLASIAALWLVAWAAPCVMAQTHHMDHASVHYPMHDGAVNMDTDDCGPVTAVNCKLPDLNSPIAAALGDMATTPVLLTMQPVASILPNARRHPHRDFLAPDVPAPPLHIRHLALLL